METEDNEMTHAFLGHYYRLIRRLSKLMNRDISFFDNNRIVSELMKRQVKVDIALLSQLMTRGQEVLPEDPISYEELYEYSNSVDQLLEELS